MMTEHPRRVERQGQARAGLAARPPELATGDCRRRDRCASELLEELRPGAFAIAYRMLGSVAEAEDVVQEALLRVHQALDARRADRLAARVRRHRHDAAGDRRAALGACPARALRRRVAAGADHHRRRAATPRGSAELADSLSLAMLVLLERLSPEQRAVLLLHDVFDYGYAEIAGIVGKSEANVRQLATPGPAARRAATGRAFRPRASSATSSRGGSSRPPSDGDLAGLEALLAARRRADRRRRRQGPRAGAVAARAQPRRAHAAQLGRGSRAALDGVSMRPVEVNGGPGALLARRRRSG